MYTTGTRISSSGYDMDMPQLWDINPLCDKYLPVLRVCTLIAPPEDTYLVRELGIAQGGSRVKVGLPDVSCRSRANYSFRNPAGG